MAKNIITLIFLFVAPIAQAAFEFGPIISNLTPSGAGATASYTVSNPGTTKIPVQITIVAREPNEEGKEVYKDSAAVNEMFRIFPGQLVLNPKETRTIRITYIGSPKVKNELAFRVIAEELPVDVSDPKKVYKRAVASVSIAIKYVGSLYVTPVGAKSEMALDVKHEELVEKKNKQTSKKLILAIANKGTAHHIIRKPVLKLQPLTGGKEVILEGADLSTLTNLNVLSGKARRFVIDWPKQLPVGPVKASFDPSKE